MKKALEDVGLIVDKSQTYQVPTQDDHKDRGSVFVDARRDTIQVYVEDRLVGNLPRGQPVSATAAASTAHGTTPSTAIASTTYGTTTSTTTTHASAVLVSHTYTPSTSLTATTPQTIIAQLSRTHPGYLQTPTQPVAA